MASSVLSLDYGAPSQATELARISVPTKSRVQKPGLVEVTHITPYFNAPFVIIGKVKYTYRSIQNLPSTTPMWRSPFVKSSNGPTMRDHHDSLSCNYPRYYQTELVTRFRFYARLSNDYLCVSLQSFAEQLCNVHIVDQNSLHHPGQWHQTASIIFQEPILH